MPGILSSRAGLATLFLFASTLFVFGDVYDHSGRNGTFTDGTWLDQTTTPMGGPNVYGNPGAGDDAYFYASTITAGNASAHLVSGGTLQLSGTLTATDAGTINSLTGSGTLNIQAVVQDANGYEGVMVTGGHLIAHNGANVNGASSGGTVKDTVCTGPCGGYTGGSSLTITGLGGPGNATFTTGSKLIANGGLQNFSFGLHTASTGVVSNITNSDATIDGASSLLTVSGNFSLDTQSMEITSGGVANITGNLTQLSGAPLSIGGSNSSLTVGGNLSQNTNGDTDIRITTGGHAKVDGTLLETRGQVQVDGSNSELTVNTLTDKGGFLNVTNHATLTLNGQTILDGGKDLDNDTISGNGNWENAGTTVKSNGALYVGSQTGAFYLNVNDGAKVQTAATLIGENAGSSGTVSLSDASTLWEVQAVGLSVGQNGMGEMDIASGAHLLLDSGTVFAVGLNSGSHGKVTADGNGSVIDARASLFSIGKSAGSVGSMLLTNHASLLLAKDTFIGDEGSGGLTIESASHATVSGASTKFGIGNAAGSLGSVSVEGTGSSLTVAGPTIVGVGGNGFLGVGQGGKITFNNALGLKVGEATNAQGTVVVDGSQTTLTDNGLLEIGDVGPGQATVSGGAEMSVTDARIDVGAAAGSNGSLTVTGADSLFSVETPFPMTIGGGGSGSVAVTAGGQIYSAAVGIVMAVRSYSKGSLTVSGAGSFVNVPSISFGDLPIPGFPTEGGAGVITAEDSGQIRARESLSIRASTATPSVIINNGQIAVGSGAFGPAGSLRVSQGGFLSGDAKAVQGQIIIGTGGSMSPGNSPGILTIHGSYEQDAGSTYFAEIGGTAAGSYDQIDATGAATVGGALVVRLVNGFTPTVGQTFQIVKAGSIHGAFASISEPSQAGMSLTSSATGITVKITSVVAGAPVISSATTVYAGPGLPFAYQIAATNKPTSFGATQLPKGLTVNHGTGVISGTPVTPGTYMVPIAANNAAGSGQAYLTIHVDSIAGSSVAPVASRLLNVSTRLAVQNGDNVLIGGFIVTGTVPKDVVVRGLGPSLAAFGISGALADPVLELHGPGNQVITNDNWKSTQQAALQATGIAPTNDLESAILTTLAPGSYTAVLRGKNNTTGVGLVDAYDLNPAADSQFANISTRGFVNTGNNVLIGGIIIGPGGSPSTKTLVRAIGPSLAAHGVKDALADPTLELHNSNGATIASNDDWKTTQQAAIQATGVPPTNDKESAIVATLAPGNYTAVVRGKNNSTGVGLVEFYNLP